MTATETVTDQGPSTEGTQGDLQREERDSKQPVTLAIVGAGYGDNGSSGAGSTNPSAGNNAGSATSDVPSTVVVWHVELAPQLTGDRLSGAWLIDVADDDTPDRLRRLVANCWVYVLDGANVGVVKRAIADANVTEVDLAASVTAIHKHTEELKAQVKAEKEKPGRDKLTEPRFPRIDDFEPIEFAHVGEEVAGKVLAAARGVEKMIAQWGELEGVRRRREYLREPWGKDARQLPFAEKKEK